MGNRGGQGDQAMAEKIQRFEDEYIICTHSKRAMSWDRLAVEEELKKEIRTMAKMVNILSPKNDDELIAACMPNLMMWAFNYHEKHCADKVKKGL